MDARLKFLSEQKLGRALREGRVSQKEQMVCLLLFNFFLTVSASSFINHFVYEDIVLNVFDYLADGVMVLAVIVITLLTYGINRKGDDRDFITRTLCLSVPAVIKSALLMVVIGFIATELDYYLYYHESDDYFRSTFGPYSIAAIVATFSFVYWRMAVGFKIASGQVA